MPLQFLKDDDVAEARMVLHRQSTTPFVNNLATSHIIDEYRDPYRPRLYKTSAHHKNSFATQPSLQSIIVIFEMPYAYQHRRFKEIRAIRCQNHEGVKLDQILDAFNLLLINDGDTLEEAVAWFTITRMETADEIAGADDGKLLSPPDKGWASLCVDQEDYLRMNFPQFYRDLGDETWKYAYLDWW